MNVAFVKMELSVVWIRGSGAAYIAHDRMVQFAKIVSDAMVTIATM